MSIILFFWFSCSENEFRDESFEMLIKKKMLMTCFSTEHNLKMIQNSYKKELTWKTKSIKIVSPCCSGWATICSKKREREKTSFKDASFRVQLFIEREAHDVVVKMLLDWIEPRTH